MVLALAVGPCVLGREGGLLRLGLRLDLAEEDMSEQEVSIRRVGMVLEILADGAVRLGELP